MPNAAEIAGAFDLKYWRVARANISRASDRAAMWAARESARKVKSAAKKPAPVYRGPDRTVKVNGRDVPLVPGEFKKSIHSSKRFQRVGASRRIAVGPRGLHVHLYAQKLERQNGVMRQAFAQVAPQVGGIHEKAMKRALRKYG